MILIWFIILASSPILSLCQDEPIVNTPLGPVLGKIHTSRKKFKFYSFRGIRYAEAPVLNLRLKPPVPVKPWKGTFDATKDGPACIQEYWDYMSEDCLRLNVYTQNINGDKLRPVLFFIHGGEFERGSSQSRDLSPEYLMDHDIVVVTINYRLGTLGFFSTGDEIAPGNYGMKDQAEALQWVKNNIQAFGGDPNKVTIAGEEAGAASVIYHLISPMSKGLFQRAIAMSGSALNNLMITRDPLPLAKKQALYLDCPTDTSQNMVDCIRDIPTENISLPVKEVGMYLDRDDHYNFEVFTPVIESGKDESETFLSYDPLELLREGDFANVPLMIGTTRDEMAYVGRILIQNKKLHTHWNEEAPKNFYYEPNNEISAKIRDFYWGSTENPVDWNTTVGLERLSADALTIFGIIRTAKLVSNKNNQPVYLWQYNYQRKISSEHDLYENLISLGEDRGLILRSAYEPPVNDSKKDAQCADKLITLWTNFMETGNPTPKASDALDNAIWKPFKTNDPSYLNINDTLKLEKGIYYEDRVSFWEKLFPL